VSAVEFPIRHFPDPLSVKQEPIKAKKAKKPKTPSSAGKEFLNTLFAP